MRSDGTVELSAEPRCPGMVVTCSVARGRVMRWYGNVGLGAVLSGYVVLWCYTALSRRCRSRIVARCTVIHCVVMVVRSTVL